MSLGPEALRVQKIPKYTALMIQPHVQVAEDRAGIECNLDRVCNLIDLGVGYFWELPARLVVLREYFLQGVTTPSKGEHGIDSFMKTAIELDGPALQRLGEMGREYNVSDCRRCRGEGAAVSG